MKREDAKEHDVVVATANILVDTRWKDGKHIKVYAKKGTIGTIVHIYAADLAPDGDAGCLVEFTEFQPECDGVAFTSFDEIERKNT
jgi:hypothetical protein